MTPSTPPPSQTNSRPDPLRLKPEEIRARQARGVSVLPLDVRTGDAREFQPEQIPDSRWIPLSGVVSQSTTLPRAATIVTYCT